MKRGVYYINRRIYLIDHGVYPGIRAIYLINRAVYFMERDVYLINRMVYLIDRENYFRGVLFLQFSCAKFYRQSAARAKTKGRCFDKKHLPEVY